MYNIYTRMHDLRCVVIQKGNTGGWDGGGGGVRDINYINFIYVSGGGVIMQFITRSKLFYFSTNKHVLPFLLNFIPTLTI